MSSETIFLLAALGAVLVSGLSKGGFAPGAGFLATPLLALTSDPATAAAVMLPLLCLMDVFAVKSFWGLWDGRQVLAMGAGAIADEIREGRLQRERLADLPVERLLSRRLRLQKFERALPLLRLSFSREAFHLF